MQFPPHIKTDDTLKVYDQRGIKIISYKHSESQTLGGNDIPLEKFTTDNHGDNVGFAYNLPVFEKARGCYQCPVFAAGNHDWTYVSVDGTQYYQASTPSDNYLIVQPDSGLTYEMKKDSTVYMMMTTTKAHVDGESDNYAKANPFPDLQPYITYQQPFPIYDFSETLTANEKAFIKQTDYIGIIGK